MPAFVLGNGGAHYGSCQGDIVGVPGKRVLQDGTVAESGPIQCASQKAGMTCVRADTGHGFTVSREHYTIF